MSASEGLVSVIIRNQSAPEYLIGQGIIWTVMDPNVQICDICSNNILLVCFSFEIQLSTWELVLIKLIPPLAIVSLLLVFDRGGSDVHKVQFLHVLRGVRV